MGTLNFATLLTRIVTLVIAFTAHEFSHALMAVKLGDDTPRQDGRLTLNPIKHLDLFGSILLIVSGFGWAKPVRVNPYAVNRKTNAGMMLVSFAGPLANLLLALIGGLLLRALPSVYPPLSGFLPTPVFFFRSFIFINLSLMIFNLVPLSPLDGEKVAEYFIPDSFKDNWNQIQRYAPIILMTLILILPQLGINFFSRMIFQLVAVLYKFIAI